MKGTNRRSAKLLTRMEVVRRYDLFRTCLTESLPFGKRKALGFMLLLKDPTDDSLLGKDSVYVQRIIYK